MNIGKMALVATSVLLLTACAAGPNGQPNASNSAEPSASPTPTPVYVTAPLTGVVYQEGVDETSFTGKPSVACKIDNSYAARPQFGLNSTDIVFDEMVEGGLTRLVAIWHSQQPTEVGPVRSIRPMDPDIISPFGGIVCYSGGQYAFVQMMQNTPVFNASETTEQGKGTFSRTSSRPAPHNVIVNAKKLAEQHTDLAAPAAQFTYAADLKSSTAAVSGVEVTKSFTVNFPQASAQWAPSTYKFKWLRTQDGEVHKDAATGKQVAASNVVVIEVKIDRSYADRKYGNVPKTVMVSSGTAWVFSAGKYVKGTWSKASATAPIILVDAEGAPINLAPGNTWVELKPAGAEGKISIK
ncbi:DUF3048 domain-containing protein [Rhodoluna limnophila]|uniref:DUF3048 domain-containing protein n=1 Tax=Rhodoluna limnophila TaxID=232537 RepID=UPI0011064793|nr:DUF3048 domain-containing protein [Rhodoluna limnophila]